MSEYLDGNPKTALGAQKPTLWMTPASALLALGQVMALGGKKYGPYNYREKGVSATVYVDAAMRHLLSWLDGETTDPESGQSHLAHVMACCAIVIDADALGKLNDNRPPVGAAADIIRASVPAHNVSTHAPTTLAPATAAA